MFTCLALSGYDQVEPHKAPHTTSQNGENQVPRPMQYWLVVMGHDVDVLLLGIVLLMWHVLIHWSVLVVTIVVVVHVGSLPWAMP